MPEIKITNLSFNYENYGDDIFKNVSLTIDTDWKLGLIGRNGRGKTTFLKLLNGEYKYSGRIISPIKFDYFPMKIKDDKKISLEVIKEVIAPFSKWEKELEKYSKEPKYINEYTEVLDKFINNDGYIINQIIEKEVRKIGISIDILNRNFNTLSGGEQTKLLLVALFLKKNNFLLIDEPTNHLDLDGRDSVIKYLQKKKGFILVSHDRYFLDKVVNHILPINKSNIDIQKGNYSTWKVNHDRINDFEISQNEKLVKSINRLKETAKQKSNWSYKLEATKIVCGSVDRGYIGHKSAKMMKIAKCLEKRREKEIEEKTKLLKNIEKLEKLSINNVQTNNETLLDVIDFKIHYDNKLLFNNPLNFTIKSGERVWIRGKNGCGKSSLLKILIGENTNYIGNFKISSNISYISQNTDFLNGNIKEFAENINLCEDKLKATLHQLGITSLNFDKNIEDLSQGQKKKLLIASSLCKPSKLYLWDEPLNFIDLVSRTQIEDMIISKNITILFVEHDNFFGNKIATKIIDIE